ncbi:MAG: hypothetical protein QX198_14890 [Methylococcaceae bacterium]
MILIDKTFSEVTPESAEAGDMSDSGHVYVNCPYTFSELVQELKNFSETSSYPCTGSARDWVSTGYSVEDYLTMRERSESLHFSHDNPARKAKYWRKALRVAGLAI